MKVSVLIENTTCNENFVCEHGLSFYIEYKNKKILFDTGSTGAFIDNAKKLNIDIQNVDYCVISHGHDDHGGGLKSFINSNQNAPIFIHKKAFEQHFSKKSEDRIVNIGLDVDLLENGRVKLLDEDTLLSDGVSTLCDIKHRYSMPLTNGNLLIEDKGKFIKDDFVHEQDLVFKINEGYVLLVGCAHNGIKNILEHFKDKYGEMPKYVFGGFHLSSRTQTHESDEFVKDLANYLLETKAIYYTCHCTGIKAYKILKDIMKEKISYISSGNQIIIAK